MSFIFSANRLAATLRPNIKDLLIQKHKRFITPLTYNQTNRTSSTSQSANITTPDHSHKHDKLWVAERYLSAALLGVIPAAAVIHHPFMDYALALSLMVHVHWGVEAIVVDYIRPSIFGPTIPRISVALLYILSSISLGGLFVFNYTDVGLSNATRMLAKI